jgi:hypothetical protein
MDDAGRFSQAISLMVGKRLTYEQLTGKAEESQAQTEIF